MPIECMNRWEVKSQIKNGAIYRSNLISISDTEKELEEMKTLWQSNKPEDSDSSALFLRFKDIDDEYSGFSCDIAELIVKFVKEHIDGLPLTIHCFAGVSRSYAVAKFINEHYGLEIDKLTEYKNHNRYIYDSLNRYVKSGVLYPCKKSSRKHF